MLNYDHPQYRKIVRTTSGAGVWRMGQLSKRWCQLVLPKQRSPQARPKQTTSMHRVTSSRKPDGMVDRNSGAKSITGGEYVIRVDGEDVKVVVKQVEPKKWLAEAAYHSNRFSAHEDTAENAYARLSWMFGLTPR